VLGHCAEPIQAGEGSRATEAEGVAASQTATPSQETQGIQGLRAKAVQLASDSAVPPELQYQGGTLRVPPPERHSRRVLDDVWVARTGVVTACTRLKLWLSSRGTIGPTSLHAIFSCYGAGVA